jgi:hypothetical protein
MKRFKLILTLSLKRLVNSYIIRSLTRFGKSGLVGFIISFIIGLLTKFGISYYYNHIAIPKFLLGSIIIILGYFLLLLLISRLSYFKYVKHAITKEITYTPKSTGCLDDLLLLGGILLIIWTFPALILFWIIKPTGLRSSIKISIFFISAFIGTIYYFRNQRKFPTVADKVTYFSGVLLGPVGVYEILF